MRRSMSNQLSHTGWAPVSLLTARDARKGHVVMWYFVPGHFSTLFISEPFTPSRYLIWPSSYEETGPRKDKDAVYGDHHTYWANIQSTYRLSYRLWDKYLHFRIWSWAALIQDRSYYSHFTDDETIPQRSSGTGPRIHSWRVLGQWCWTPVTLHSTSLNAYNTEFIFESLAELLI